MASVFVLTFLAAIVGVFRPYINGVKRAHFGLAAFVSFILIGVFAPKTAADGSEKNTVVEAAEASENGAADSTSAETSPVDKKENAGEWVYSTQRDEMRGAESKYAQLDAVGTIDLDFPYGEQRGQILVRQSSKYGFDVLVGVPSGQIMCNSYSNSHINVKFDDGPIERFGCTDAADGTSNMVFVENSRGFLSKLKRSRKAIIEADFFQNGTQQMTFNTANLKWGE